MPVLPSRSLKKYSSLSTDSPGDVQISKSRANRTVSEPAGNRIVKALLNFRKRSEDPLEIDYSPSGPSEVSFDGNSKLETSRMMNPRSRDSGSSADESERPNVSPFVENRGNRKELLNSFDQQRKPETAQDDYSKVGNKRPTLAPFFNVINHNFRKTLKGIGSKDSFTRLETVGDE